MRDASVGTFSGFDTYRVGRGVSRSGAFPLAAARQGFGVAARLALLVARKGPAPSRTKRVVHVTPTYFDEASVIGGGERYPVCLAKAMAEHVDTTLVSFGPRRQRLRQGSLHIEIYPIRGFIGGVKHDPFSLRFALSLFGADVVHCHQSGSAVCGIATVVGRMLRAKVFATDLGGGTSPFLANGKHRDCIDGLLEISTFATRNPGTTTKREIIYGGVDGAFLGAPRRQRRRKVTFVGRLLPHKGINYLIEAVDPGIELEVFGRPYRDDYYALLREMADGKDVRFVADGSDKDIVESYASSMVSVLPSVYDDVYGTHHDAPELLGLVLLEAMACGTPVICTAVGGMPEIVEDGVTGFVVPPNEPHVLREKMQWFMEHPDRARHMGEAGRKLVLERYTWDAVAKRCLSAYFRL